PAGAYRNMAYVKPHVEILESAEECLVDLISDPQTSGGLFISLPADDALTLVRLLQEDGITAAIIGEAIPKQEKDLIIE
ncbi:MAG: selenide, water dikinase SelD, partial [Lachnospiraceae bacterium]|nr:selenide, water dikinase SelD [Lachnospiraceae bacterium]